MSLQIRRLRSDAPDFAAELDALAATEPVADPALTRAVADILARVRAAQERLSRSAETMGELATLFPNCTMCRHTTDLDSGFHDSDHLCT